MPRKDRTKRKARKELVKKHDLTKPVLIPLEKIGSNDDPCFGKLNDPRHPICQQCGDIEICAIVMGQLNHLKRLEQEKKNAFKDIEESNISKRSLKETRIALKREAKQVIQERGSITQEELVLDLFGKFMHEGLSKPKIKKIISKIPEKSKNVILKNNQYKWNK